MEIIFFYSFPLLKKSKGNLPQNTLDKTHLHGFIDEQTALKDSRKTNLRRIKRMKHVFLDGRSLSVLKAGFMNTA
jgi:hypothetical protein